MPIYVDYKKENQNDYEVLGIRHDINGKDFKYIMKLREIVEAASLNFLYKSNSDFCGSISRAIGWTTNIANFDIARCRGRIDESRYASMMREFITQCNIELEKSKQIRFYDSRFDIFGGWTRGEIVLMVPKNKKGWKK